jgi:hypothetical protein
MTFHPEWGRPKGEGQGARNPKCMTTAKSLAQYILAPLSPSRVSEVKLDMRFQEILDRVEHPREIQRGYADRRNCGS